MSVLKAAVSNKNTTIAGIASLVVIIAGVIQKLSDGDPSTVVDWNSSIAAITAAIALIFARDADKSSEDSGVGPIA